MKIRNFTPHTITLNGGREFPSEGLARVAVTHSEIATIEGIPFTSTVYGEVQGLPDQEEGTLIIVSGMVASALPDRHDLIAPATGHPDCIRENGQVRSVPAFTWNNRD